MKQKYIDVNFRSESIDLIVTINDIITDYVQQGFRLTVRQLYYQLVSKALIENTERSYKRITGLVNDARMAGLMDWDAIEDRTRSFIRRTHWHSGSQILEASSQSFHMDMWDNQHTRLFCIVEKEALAGVLEGVCLQFDVPLLAARGYPSGTVLREFAQADLIHAAASGQHIVILHLGDHDPSGIDMTRDLENRIQTFAQSPVELVRIALNMEQIQKQKPPPNPAKTTDSRFESYLREFGSESWELDALKPRFLTDLVRSHIEKWIDEDSWDTRKVEINYVKSRIKKFAEDWKD